MEPGATSQLDSKPDRIRGILTRSVDLLEDERLIRSGYASYASSALLGYNSRLHLTNKRLIFVSLKVPFSWAPPLTGPALVINLETVSQVGPARLRRRLFFWLDTWYVEASGKKYWFSTLKDEGRPWLELLASTAGVPVGEPRALYT